MKTIDAIGTFWFTTYMTFFGATTALALMKDNVLYSFFAVAWLVLAIVCFVVETDPSHQ